MKIQLLFFTLLISTSHLYAADDANEIMSAIEDGDRERARQLINADNINIKLSYLENTPLDYAIQFNDIIALDLIKLGANVQYKDIYNRTPLHFAAFYNKPTVAQKLLKAGALTTEKDADGKTPLDIAKQREQAEVIQILESWENEDIKEPGCD